MGKCQLMVQFNRWKSAVTYFKASRGPIVEIDGLSKQNLNSQDNDNS